MKKKDNTQVQPKDKMGSRAKSAIYIGGVIITILLLAIAISFFQNTNRMSSYQNVLQGVYSSAYYNMVDKVNELAIDADKAVVSTTPASTRRALNNMTKNCESIVTSLSVLSIDAKNVVDMTQFYNQLGGMCDAYQEKLFAGKTLSNEDLAQLKSAVKSISSMKTSLNAHNESVAGGEYDFVDNNSMQNGVSKLGSSMGDMTVDSMEYPAMIFDGPFSAGLENKEIKGLSKKTVTREEAKKIVSDKIFAGDKISFVDEKTTNADFDTYDFSVKHNGQIFFIQIAYRDGMPLTISACALESVSKIKLSKAESIAEEFAKKLGIEDMKCIWSESSVNIAYINLAPVVDGVIYYPDLIKVKVDLATGIVIGWEAENYAYNHTTRKISANIMEEEMLADYGTDTKVNNVTLCVIPLDIGGEATCYEIIMEKIDGTYYKYVNANSGEVIKIMKEITTDKMHKLI